MNEKDIPVAKPYLGPEECLAAGEVIRSGWVTQGPRVAEFERRFAGYVGSEFACAVSSCTTALHLALLTVGASAGTHVITVSHSFIATANAVRYCGAEPLFVDIDPDTYNISVPALRTCLENNCHMHEDRLVYGPTGRPVSAVLPVHQMGMPCEIRKIVEMARKHGLPVVEDAACAIGCEITGDGKTWERIGAPHGDIACFSFHPRKVITTGDGGMLTTNSADYDRNFRLLRQHGMSISDRQRHESGKILFESYPVVGFNYRMTDIQAAMGIEQLNKLPFIIKERRRIENRYRQALAPVQWLRTPSEPAWCRTNWQSYPVRILENAPVTRDALMQLMLDHRIATRPGIMNAHSEGAYADIAPVLPESENARDRVILLPFFVGLTDGDIRRIAETVQKAGTGA
ncbi:DegT/DnrJ/EryC1/StrS family aminotransferase [bacterium]|nr:DegT/DnrJ/EryC1/StrS family aminotransferase [bacterium]